MTSLPPATISARGRYRQYAEHEKQAAMTLAVEHGVSKAATLLEMPERTLAEWMKSAGGLAAIRQVSREASLGAMRGAVSAISEALRLKAAAGELTAKQLLEAHLGHVDAAAVVAKAQVSGRTDGPSAQAAAHILVQIRNDAGGVDLIEVPRDRPGAPALAQPADPDRQA